MFQSKNVQIIHKGKRLEQIKKATISLGKEHPYITLETLNNLEDEPMFYLVEQIDTINNLLKISVVTVEESLQKMRSYSSSEKVIDIRDWQSR